MPGRKRNSGKNPNKTGKKEEGAPRSSLRASVPVVTLTTDFGDRDHFTGSLRGVLLSLRSDLRTIDITHQISPHDIISAAFVIKEAYRYFPGGSIHLVVVDPGVGTDRKKIVVSQGEHLFVAPDNGVLTYIVRMKGSAVYEVGESRFIRFEKSSTFAGRDHFAPIAALLAQGIPPWKLGKETEAYHSLDNLFPETREGGCLGKIVYIDHFGNAITNFTESELNRRQDPKGVAIRMKEHRMTGLKKSYSEGEPGLGNLIVNSSGHLEIFVPRQSARSLLNLRLLDEVFLERS